MWAFSSEEPFTVLSKSMEALIPVCVHEKLTNSFLRGISTKHCPSVCSMLDSLIFHRMQFSIATNSLGNSYMVFKRKSRNDEPWSKGVAGLEFLISSQILSFRGFPNPPFPPSLYGMLFPHLFYFSEINIIVNDLCTVYNKT